VLHQSRFFEAHQCSSLATLWERERKAQLSPAASIPTHGGRSLHPVKKTGQEIVIAV